MIFKHKKDKAEKGWRNLCINYCTFQKVS